jgi:multiple sugar transport system ATP-binding protein
MNLLRGGIANGAFVSDRGLSLPIEVKGASDQGRQVAYGIRPEHFQLSDHGVPVRVSLVEPTGSETQVMVEAESGEALSCVFRDRIDAEPGATIRIAPIPRLVHLFDSDTGARIT